ncbi:MAG: diaminopimelate decarboxylase [bacterium]|nr:diaminopimelate decarboxylase [bacterium]
MESFEYRGGVLHCEEVALPVLAAEFGTPTYVYSRRALIERYDALAEAFAPLNPKLCFAVKSCHNTHILRLLGEHGAAFDVVSGGEVFRAITAGADPGDIVFAGVGKTDSEIAAAIEAGVGCFNVESEAELAVLAGLAEQGGKVVQVALRVNPDVDAHTHPYTTTGKQENKFGIDLDCARELFKHYSGHSWVRVSGVHMHLGSPVNTVDPYVQAIGKLLGMIDELRAAGVGIDLFNLGGGWGAGDGETPSANPAEYARSIVPLFKGRDLRIHLEPGRSIAANSAVLLERTIYIKEGCVRRFVIGDAAMTDLIRPALYQAYHFLWPVEPGDGFVPPHHRSDLKLPGCVEVDVVGPVCESGDFLAKGRWLPPVKRGDLLAVFSAGAYGAVMSSQYNSRPRAAEVLVDGDTLRLIRRRETYDDLIAAEEGL